MWTTLHISQPLDGASLLKAPLHLRCTGRSNVQLPMRRYLPEFQENLPGSNGKCLAAGHLVYFIIDCLQLPVAKSKEPIGKNTIAQTQKDCSCCCSTHCLAVTGISHHIAINVFP